MAHSSPHALRRTLSTPAGDEVQIASTAHNPSTRTVHSRPGLSVDRPGDEKARLNYQGSGLASPPPVAGGRSCGHMKLTKVDVI
jgi:hypothetical protein